METFKDSGQRQEFETGARRDTSSGKGRFDLMPAISNFFLSRIYEVGCLKYGDRNWEKGIPLSRYLDSAQRHIAKYQAGLRDEPHLSMAAWNLMCALWTASMITIGMRPQALNDLVNHVGPEPAMPLSPNEVASLETFLGRSIKAVPCSENRTTAGANHEYKPGLCIGSNRTASNLLFQNPNKGLLSNP